MERELVSTAPRVHRRQHTALVASDAVLAARQRYEVARQTALGTVWRVARHVVLGTVLLVALLSCLKVYDDVSVETQTVADVHGDAREVWVFDNDHKAATPLCHRVEFQHNKFVKQACDKAEALTKRDPWMEVLDRVLARWHMRAEQALASRVAFFLMGMFALAFTLMYRKQHRQQQQPRIEHVD